MTFDLAMNSYHTKSKRNKRKNKSDFIKIKKYAAKDNINKVKSDSATERQTVQIQYLAKNLNRHFSEDDIQIPNHGKNSQYH